MSSVEGILIAENVKICIQSCNWWWIGCHVQGRCQILQYGLQFVKVRSLLETLHENSAIRPAKRGRILQFFLVLTNCRKIKVAHTSYFPVLFPRSEPQQALRIISTRRSITRYIVTQHALTSSAAVVSANNSLYTLHCPLSFLRYHSGLSLLHIHYYSYTQ